MEKLDLANNIPDALVQLSKLDGNTRCADCGANDSDWVSLGFSVLVCIECAGQHRSFGTHITQIRSISMDVWTDSQIMRLAVGGNNNFLSYLNSVDDTDLSSLAMKYTSPGILYYR